MKVYVVVDISSGYCSNSYDPVYSIDVFQNLDDAKKHFKNACKEYMSDNPEKDDIWTSKDGMRFTIINCEDDYSAELEILEKEIK